MQLIGCLGRGPGSDERAKPADHGFQPVRLPSTTRGVGSTWLGLVWRLDLGSQGSLAGDESLSGHLAWFWTPSTTAPSVQLGLRFPGVDVDFDGIGGFGGFSIQNLIGVTNQSAALTTTADNGSGFELTIQGLALGVVGMRLPWGGSIDLQLTSDPVGRNDALAWYGRYLPSTSKPKTST